jgi:hypothetical protein
MDPSLLGLFSIYRLATRGMFSFRRLDTHSMLEGEANIVTASKRLDEGLAALSKSNCLGDIIDMLILPLRILGC